MIEESKGGKLKIGDEWSAIVIIARTQTTPQKAVAELVENSIDAHARNVQIQRKKVKTKEYSGIVLWISDDGDGVPPDARGIPNFDYIATHICDSIKRKLTAAQREGIKGEFAIGLLGFWCIGKKLNMVSRSSKSGTYAMIMREESPNYHVKKMGWERKHLGTDVIISELHPNIQYVLTGEKLQKYLGRELRGRIKESGVNIVIIDTVGRRKSFVVKPEEFKGEKIADVRVISTVRYRDITAELYITFPKEMDIPTIGVYRGGTQVLRSILELEEFNNPPWNMNRLEGLLDFPKFNIAPGTRTGILRDEAFQSFLEAVKAKEPKLVELIKEKEKTMGEKASKDTMKVLQEAFAEIWKDLPEGEYNWFDIGKKGGLKKGDVKTGEEVKPETTQPPSKPQQTPGPLDHVNIIPHITNVVINSEKTFFAKPYDANNVLIEDGVTFSWNAMGSLGTMVADASNTAIFRAGSNIGVTNIEVTVTQGSITRKSGATIVIVLEKKAPEEGEKPTKGLPPYTTVPESLETWRSRWEPSTMTMEVNSGHPDYVPPSKTKGHRKYIGKLYAKELVLLNFPTSTQSNILERIIEVLVRLEKRIP